PDLIGEMGASHDDVEVAVPVEIVEGGGGGDVGLIHLDGEACERIRVSTEPDDPRRAAALANNEVVPPIEIDVEDQRVDLLRSVVVRRRDLSARAREVDPLGREDSRDEKEHKERTACGRKQRGTLWEAGP